MSFYKEIALQELTEKFYGITRKLRSREEFSREELLGIMGLQRNHRGTEAPRGRRKELRIENAEALSILNSQFFLRPLRASVPLW